MVIFRALNGPWTFKFLGTFAMVSFDAFTHHKNGFKSLFSPCFALERSKSVKFMSHRSKLIFFSKCKPEYLKQIIIKRCDYFSQVCKSTKLINLEVLAIIQGPWTVCGPKNDHSKDFYGGSGPFLGQFSNFFSTSWKCTYEVPLKSSFRA